MKLYRPFPIDKEMKINTNSMMVTKTDMRGDIRYINESFTSVVGYEKEEIIGTPHDALRHPDMPDAIFLLIIKAIEKGEKIRAVVKNLAKSGEYYWAVTDFEADYDENNQVSSFFAFREPILEENIDELVALYQVLLDIERRRGVEASLKYLNNYLYENSLSYNEFMEIMSRPKSLIQRIFVKSFAPNDKEKNNYRQNSCKMVA